MRSECRERDTGMSPGLLPLFDARKKGRKPAKINLEGVTRMLKEKILSPFKRLSEERGISH